MTTPAEAAATPLQDAFTAALSAVFAAKARWLQGGGACDDDEPSETWDAYLAADQVARAALAAWKASNEPMVFASDELEVELVPYLQLEL
jgi:hypothetical protein